MIIGLTVLALLILQQLISKLLAEPILKKYCRLPSIIFCRLVFWGLLLTGLLGAFMGTFSGTLNAAQAYIVNDIYLKYINPAASTKKIITMNYIVGLLVVIIGIVLGFFAKNVNSVLQWIVGALYGGYIAANMFKWYWWRFNANWFFLGHGRGIAARLFFRIAMSGFRIFLFSSIYIIGHLYL